MVYCAVLPQKLIQEPIEIRRSPRQRPLASNSNPPHDRVRGHVHHDRYEHFPGRDCEQNFFYGGYVLLVHNSPHGWS